MQKAVFLNSRDTKAFLNILKEHYGFEGELPYSILRNSQNRFYVINKEIADIDLSNLRIDSVGMYLGEEYKGMIRLSIEGSQLLGPHCSKHVLELHPNQIQLWMRGHDIVGEQKERGFVIIKCGDDYFGCGNAHEDKILNYVSKARRIRSDD